MQFARSVSQFSSPREKPLTLHPRREVGRCPRANVQFEIRPTGEFVLECSWPPQTLLWHRQNPEEWRYGELTHTDCVTPRID